MEQNFKLNSQTRFNKSHFPILNRELTINMRISPKGGWQFAPTPQQILTQLISPTNDWSFWLEITSF